MISSTVLTGRAEALIFFAGAPSSEVRGRFLRLVVGEPEIGCGRRAFPLYDGFCAEMGADGAYGCRIAGPELTAGTP